MQMDGTGNPELRNLRLNGSRLQGKTATVFGPWGKS